MHVWWLCCYSENTNYINRFLKYNVLFQSIVGTLGSSILTLRWIKGSNTHLVREASAKIPRRSYPVTSAPSRRWLTYQGPPLCALCLLQGSPLKLAGEMLFACSPFSSLSLLIISVLFTFKLLLKTN